MGDLTRDSDRIIENARLSRDVNRDGGYHRRAPSIGAGSAKIKQGLWLKFTSALGMGFDS